MAEEDNTPKRVMDVPIVDATLRGMLFAVHEDEIVFLSMAGIDQLYLPVFKDLAELDELLTKVNVKWDGVKRVSDAREFADSLPLDVSIISDIRFLDTGKMRFKILINHRGGDVGGN